MVSSVLRVTGMHCTELAFWHLSQLCSYAVYRRSDSRLCNPVTSWVSQCFLLCLSFPICRPWIIPTNYHLGKYEHSWNILKRDEILQVTLGHKVLLFCFPLIVLVMHALHIFSPFHWETLKIYKEASGRISVMLGNE